MRQRIFEVFSLINAAIARQQVEITVRVCTRSLLLLTFLRDSGYINGFIHDKQNHKCTILFNYCDNRPVLKQLIPVSKPGRKVFCSMFSLTLFLSKVNSKKITTTSSYVFPLIFSDGKVVSHFECFRKWRGGEVICLVAA